jgi:hypothetical protein
MGVELELSDDGTILYCKNGNLLSRLTTAEVEKTLGNIGLMRTGMSPPVAPKWERGQHANCRRDPEFDVEGSMLGEAIVHIRDERFGWLHYVLSQDEARRLREKLVAAAVEPAPPTHRH